MNRSETHQPCDSRFRDLLMGSPLILFSLFALAGFAILVPQQWRAADYFPIASEIASAAFMAMQLILVCVRRLPIDKAAGFAPRAWAFAGANFGYVLLLLPRVPLGNFMTGLSTSVTVAGTLGSMVTLMWLGKAFSVFPQARTLVTTGPYACVRHPLYVFEQLAMLGVSLQYRQPWALFLIIGSFALQFPRMHYEEMVLRKTFPMYDAYASVTPRLIPFLRRTDIPPESHPDTIARRPETSPRSILK